MEKAGVLAPAFLTVQRGAKGFGGGAKPPGPGAAGLEGYAVAPPPGGWANAPGCWDAVWGAANVPGPAGTVKPCAPCGANPPGDALKPAGRKPCCSAIRISSAPLTELANTISSPGDENTMALSYSFTPRGSFCFTAAVTPAMT